jgi:hypothetical protein
VPFTVSPSSYVGGQLLAQGINTAAQGITGAIQHFSDTADQANKADALMQYLSQQTDPTTGKPMFDQKALQAYQNHSQRQRAYIAGGITAGMSLVPALQHYARVNQQVPYQVGGQTYNIAPAEAARLQTQQANKVPPVPTEVGGKTINLPPSSAASAELEKQRIDLAKQPKGLTQQQVFQQQQAVDKAFQDKIKASPEYDFTKKYAVQPQQVLTPDVLDPGKQAYRLFATDPKGNPTEIQPEYDQYGIPRRPSYLPSDTPTYWSPASSIYRGNKITRNVGGTKTEQFAPDPTGEHVDIGGQKIPFSAIQSINQRHDLLLKQATAALGKGADWQALAKQWSALGYNVQELPEPSQQ